MCFNSHDPVSASSDRVRWRQATALGVAMVGLGWAGNADASNTGKPRVPPSFLGPGCIETVDRSVDPIWHFDVGIPFEDTALTEDEPPDGRTFQFFALCRQPGPLEELPLWVDGADASAAVEFDPTIELPGVGEPLDESMAWAGCVQTITPAAQRVPITCVDTMGGASWDTTGVPAGAHAIWGYTYEPAQNLWTPRDGMVRVIDGDDASAGPAVSFSWPLTEVTAGLDAGIRVAGCVAGMAGTSLTLEWATAGALDAAGDAAWQPFAELSDPGSTFDVALVPPPEAEFEAVFFRAVVRDPRDRSFTAFTRERVVFLSGCDEPSGGARSLPDDCGVGSGSPVVPEGARGAGGCDPPGDSGAVDETGDPSTTGTGPTGGSDDATGQTGAADGEGGGCGCRAQPLDARWASLLLLLGMLRVRRRRLGYSVSCSRSQPWTAS